MRSLSIFAITVVTRYTQIAVAQVDVAAGIIKDSPACALPCIEGIITDGTCSIDSIAPCVCKNVTIQANLSVCVQEACDFDDQVRSGAIENYLCVGYPQESKPDSVKLLSVVGSAIVFPIAILRFVARFHVTGRLWIDDYLTLASTATLIAIVAIAFASTDLGLGKHYWNLDPATGMLLLQRFYIVQILYIANLTFSKLAIAVLLRRIFQTSNFQKIVNALSIFLLVNGLVFLLLDSLQCMPVQSVWDLSIPGRTCLNINSVSLSGAVLAIVDDVSLLLLPLPWVWGLQLTYRTRLGLFFIFSLGSFTCVTSMVRLKYISTFVRSYDPTWDDVDVVFWSLIEMFTSLLCGCIPALWPLLVRLSPRLFSHRSFRPSNQYPSKPTNRLSQWISPWSFILDGRQNSALRMTGSNDILQQEAHTESQTLSQKGSDLEENIVMTTV